MCYGMWCFYTTKVSNANKWPKLYRTDFMTYKVLIYYLISRDNFFVSIWICQGTCHNNRNKLSFSQFWTKLFGYRILWNFTHRFNRLLIVDEYKMGQLTNYVYIPYFLMLLAGIFQCCKVCLSHLFQPIIKAILLLMHLWYTIGWKFKSFIPLITLNICGQKK